MVAVLSVGSWGGIMAAIVVDLSDASLCQGVVLNASECVGLMLGAGS